MSIDINTLRKLEKLSMIKLDKRDKEKLIKNVSSVIDWAQIVTSKDTSSIEALGAETIERIGASTLRIFDDIELKNNTREEVLANAPKIEDHMFVVPKVVE